MANDLEVLPELCIASDVENNPVRAVSRVRVHVLVAGHNRDCLLALGIALRDLVVLLICGLALPLHAALQYGCATCAFPAISLAW